MAQCNCKFCKGTKEVANGGRYTVATRKELCFGDAPEWSVVGPCQGVEHLKVFWGCNSKAEAESQAEQMNLGMVPPETEMCDGCKKFFPVGEVVSQETNYGKLTFCKNCRKG